MGRCNIKLDELCNVITDGSHNPPKGIESSEYMMLSSKNIFNNKITFDEPRYLSKEDFEVENKRTNISKGDVLLTIVGTVGRSAVVDDGMEKFTVQRSVAVLKPSDKIMSKYLMYALIKSSDKLMKESRGIAQKGIYLKQIKKFEIPVYGINNQEYIVKVLDTVSEVINIHKKRLENLDNLIKSTFYEMFGELKIENYLTLGECTKFIDYRGKTPKLSEKGIRIINAKSVGKGFFKYIDEYVSEETYYSWMKRGFPQAGDILFVTEGHTFGNVCRIPDDLKKFAMGQRIIAIQANKDILNNIFLSEYMRTINFQKQINRYKTGSSAQGIRSKKLIKVLIPIPSINLQNKFAIIVKEIEEQKSIEKQAIKDSENLFNSLMSKYFD